MWFGRCAWGTFGGMGWGSMLGGGVMMLLFWGGLILLAVLAWRAYQGRTAKVEAGVGLEVLKVRYARG